MNLRNYAYLLDTQNKYRDHDKVVTKILSYQKVSSQENLKHTMALIIKSPQREPQEKNQKPNNKTKTNVLT